jgi:uncharacterized membrane protein
MRRLWKHKWLVVVTAVLFVLALGTVAWAATGGASDPTPAGATVTTATGSTATTAVQGQHPLLRERLKQRLEKIKARDQAIVKAARAKMTPADQATLDQLIAKAKDQQTALQQARQNLGQTLKDIRGLVGKYVPVNGVGATATTATTAATAAQ